LGDGSEAEEPVEFFGDGEILAVQHLNVGQLQQILAIATAASRRHLYSQARPARSRTMVDPYSECRRITTRVRL
jgi:hypothetical protein